mmetsp:Transcript_11169/g.12295  ORF Transcript_11169/g.12295 Transcript_11169/m.12295 type:complete len:172 (+) Transcript_11169:1-516(+)
MQRSLLDSVAGLFVAFVPALRSYSAFLYENLALVTLCGLTQLLLGIELFLTYQQARRRTNHPPSLTEDQVRHLVERGVSMLARSINRSTVLAPTLTAPPVWDRGLNQGVAKRFLEIYAGDPRTDKAAQSTSDLCIQLVKPMTSKARCSVWEALSAGFCQTSQEMASANITK